MTTLVDAPSRVDGVQLIGEMEGSGYRTPPALVRRGDGQVLQLTPLLYLVLNAADGRRGCREIAELVGRQLGRAISEADVRTLIDGHLRPLGLIKRADGTEPELRRSDPLLSLKPRFAVTNPKSTRRLTDPFQILFRPVVAAAVFVGFVVVVAWVFFDRGLGASAYDAFERPHLLLLVFAVSVLSGGFHEFGHAAAARYSGAEPGAMGAGLYVVWPAFYTDVTDSYRLDRAGRIRTDLGGLYFNAIVVVGTFVWWWATGWEALLLLVATQVLQMAQQLLPLLRFDGYHLLADLAGVPDLYQRIRPTLLGLLPHRWHSPENRALKPSARAVVTLWVLVTIPMMALMLLALVAAVPRLLGSAGAAMREDAAAATAAWRTGDPLDVTAHAFQALGVLLPLLAAILILGRVGFRSLQGLARWSQDSVVKRAVAVALSATAVTALSWAWWPHPGTYRPIAPGEERLFTTLFQGSPTPTAAGSGSPAEGIATRPGALPLGTAAQKRLSGDQPLVAAFQEGERLPTKRNPALAMVLVPTDRSGAHDPSSPGPADGNQTDADGSSSGDDTWVFPFDKPLLPTEGDNQALAVVTKDGSVSYDVAFALVWAQDDEVLNVNEAHAYASCSDCVAVAVAFQVVLIMDDAQVVVPQNLAIAANYECYRCITAAIASQLVLSVQSEPGEEELLALYDVWSRLTEFAQTITSYSLTQISDQLEAYKAEIVAILGEVPTIESQQSSSTTSSATQAEDPTDSPVPPTPNTTTAPPTPSPTPEGAPTPPPATPSAEESPATSPTPSPTESAPAPSPSATTAENTSTPTDSPSP